MRIRIILIMIFSLFLNSNINAQSKEIKGTIISNKTKKPVFNAIVKLVDVNNKYIAFYLSEKDGSFVFKNIKTNKKLRLIINCLGYEVTNVDIENTNLRIELKEKITKLKEVKIKSKSVLGQGDTTVYRVSSFSDIKDTKLEDVLVKLPGIEVGKNGTISFQGKPISNFYIEGSDMLGGRYTLATKNINCDDVATVEVMKRHQPIKMLSDIVISDNTALNIKLKEKAKNKWIGAGSIGLGYKKFLWDLSAVAMNFSKRLQNFIVYKTGNLGEDLKTQLHNYFSSNSLYSIGYFSSSVPMCYQLSRERRLFNTTHIASINNLVKFSDDYVLKTNIQLGLDKQEGESMVSNTYYTSKSEKTFISRKKGDLRTKDFNVDICLNANEKTYYFDNNLSVAGGFLNSDFISTGTDNYNHSIEIPDFKIGNNLKIMKQFGNKIFNIKSFVDYRQSNQDFNILFKDRYTKPTNQNVDISILNIRNYISHSFTMGDFYTSLEGFYKLKKRWMSQNLDWNDKPINSIKTGYSYSQLVDQELGIDPNIQYRKGVFSSSLSQKLSWRYINLLDTKIEKSVFVYSPTINLNLTPVENIDLELGSSYSNLVESLDCLYLKTMYSSPRDLLEGINNISEGKKFTVHGDFEWKNIDWLLFFNSSISYSWAESSRTSDFSIEDSYFINRYLNIDKNYDRFTCSFNLSKTLPLYSLLKLSPSYSIINADNYRDGLLIKSKKRLYSLKLLYNFSPIEDLEISLSGRATRSESSNSINDNKFNQNNYKCSMGVSYSIMDNWTIGLDSQYFANELLNDKYAEITFYDLFSRLKLNWGSLELKARNLSNETVYKYSISNALSRSSSIYYIRPINVVLKVNINI